MKLWSKSFSSVDKHYLWAAAALVIVLGLLWIPTEVVRVENTAKEEAEYIRRIYDGHTVGQSILLYENYELTALQVLARGEGSYPATIIATNDRGEELGRANVQLTSEDQWFQIPMKPKLRAGTHVITLAAPEGTLRNKTILIRYQPQSYRYEGGNMIVDGKASYGDIAFRVIDRAPAWEYVVIKGQITDRSIKEGILYIVWGMGVLVLTLVTSTYKLKRWPSSHIWIPILLIFVTAVIIRAPLTKSIEGVFGGDAFNYFGKAHALFQGNDPFAADPRKGPLYSFLLLPAFLMEDMLLWSRWVGVIAAAATAGLLPFVGKRLGLPWPLATMSGLLLAVNHEFIWEAPSGLANTAFTFFIVASVFAYLQIAVSRKWLWVLSVCAALTMLTRFEGALVGAILLPAAWWRYRLPLKQIVPVGLLAVALMAVPLVSIVWSGVSGIRTAEDIAGDEGLYLVRGIFDEQLKYNTALAYEFFTNLWMWRGPIYPIATLLGIGIGLGVVMLFASYRWPAVKQYVWPTAAIVALAGFIVLIMMNNEIGTDTIVVSLYLLSGIGLVQWLKSKPFDAAVILLTIFIQVGIVLWILPKGRYFLPTIPFLSVAIVSGLYTFVPEKESRPKLVRLLPVMSLLGIATIIFYVEGHKITDRRVSEYNEKAQETAVLVKALQYFRAEGYHVGAYESGDVPTMVYIPAEKLHLFREKGEEDKAMQELRWIHSEKVEWVIARSGGWQWDSIEKYPELFDDARTFTSPYGDAEMFAHAVNHQKLEEFLVQ